MRSPRAADRLDGRPLLPQDLAGQRQRQLVDELQRRRRITGLGACLLDRRGRYPLANRRDGLLEEGEDHPAGEEAAAVLDHDRRLADLQREVEDLGQGRVGGLLPSDDLDKRHLVGRGEEVDADEVFLVPHATALASSLAA
jgi:hypothetical protein